MFNAQLLPKMAAATYLGENIYTRVGKFITEKSPQGGIFHSGHLLRRKEKG
jgi:uncharacterized membrane protein